MRLALSVPVLLLSTLPLQSTVDRAIAIPVRTAAVSGVVTDGGSRLPLRGAAVRILDRRVQVAAGTLTDSKGRFVFRDLPASGGYTLSVTKAGYTASGLVGNGLFVPASWIVVDDDEWVADVQIVMWRLGSIGGTVVDERGEPLVDIPVRAWTQVPVAGTTQWAAGPTARTDDRGVYRLAGLRAGAYLVHVGSVQSTVPRSTSLATMAGWSEDTATRARQRGVEPPRVRGLDVQGSWLRIGTYATPPPIEGSLRAYPPQYYGNATSPVVATPINLQYGEGRTSVDFVLQPMATVGVSGRLDGPVHTVAGLAVRLLPSGAEDFGPGHEHATTVTDRDGTFIFAGVPQGDYTLDVSPSLADLNVGGGTALTRPPGMISENIQLTFLPVSSHVVTLRQTGAFQEASAYGARLPLSVGAADVSGVIVPLQQLAAISGRIVREDGRALPDGTTISVEPVTGNPALGARFTYATPEGTFSIRGLRDGAYWLRSSASGRVKSIVATDGEYSHRPLEVTGGTDLTGVVVTLADRAAAVSGVVRDPRDQGGDAAGESAVILFPAERDQWTRFGFTPPRIKSVASFGRAGYEITGVPAGEYYIIAVDPSLRDAWFEPWFFRAAAPQATRVTLVWGDTVVRDLMRQDVRIP